MNEYGKFKFTTMWNQTSLNYAYNTLTQWKEQDNNVWTLDSATRLLVQNKTPGVLGIGTTAAHFNQASIYRNLATVFPMKTRRDVLSVGLKYRLTDTIGLNLAFSSTKKTGNQPYGAAFAFNNGNELPMSVDNRTNDLTAALEWAKASTGMLRVAWDGSWFNNQYQSLTWDNPLRATDFNNERRAEWQTNMAGYGDAAAGRGSYAGQIRDAYGTANQQAQEAVDYADRTIDPLVDNARGAFDTAKGP